MIPPSNSWPNTPLGTGLLLFAQTMRELLDEQSFESFRAYSLDTPSRLDEAIQVLEDIKSVKLPKKAFEPILSELIWSFESDPLLGDSLKSEISFLKDQLNLDKFLPEEVQTKIEIFKRNYCANYKEKLENAMISIIANERRRNSLRELTSLYCTHILNLGYSRRFVFENVVKHFFERDILRSRTSLLVSFFDKFSGIKKKLNIYFLVNKDYGSYLSKLGHRVYTDAAHTPTHIQNAFGHVLNFATLSAWLFKGEALDVYQAIIKAKEQLTSVRSITVLDPTGLSCSWENIVYSTSFNTSNGHLIEITEVRTHQTVPNPRLLKRLEQYSTKIHSNFDGASLERILSSTNTVSLALDSSYVENKLISLWSSFEILLSNPPPDTARIVHYTRLITPCICKRYVRLHIIHIYENLLKIYKRRFVNIVNKETYVTENNPHLKFAAILLIEDNKDLRDELCALCSNNPLALQRMHHVHTNYSNLTKALKNIISHENRVNWQLHRIYRARNNIVHAGRVPTYLDSIIRNAFEYYKSSLVAIVKCSEKNSILSNIDSVVIENSLDYLQKKRQIEMVNDKSKIDVTSLRLIYD